MEMARKLKVLVIVLSVLLLVNPAFAAKKNLKTQTTTKEAATVTTTPEKVKKLAYAGPVNQTSYVDPVKYTLGPEDVIEIAVLRHPEFSGQYPINLEGKIQYKFVGDIEVNGLTKKELEKKIAYIVSKYIINPEVNVTILEYKSKVIYVIGEVVRPGKYYMRSETIPVREAVVTAGLPSLTAAMRKCRLITPSEDGKPKTKYVNLFSLLYEGNLKENVDMRPGDVLYVPATVMAKVMRVIRPVSEPVTDAASTKGAVAGF